MIDCLIRNGTVIDGSGAVGRQADVGIDCGRVVAVGRVDEAAARVVDARGRIVCPGFIDLHTHYDAQVFWDPTLSPSCQHGVTTVVAGNCGFSIAPLVPPCADYLMRMLARVEGMPLESLRGGVPWNWTDFASFLGALEGRVGLNVGFLVGHSALRSAVMRERGVAGASTAEDRRAMVRLLGESIRAGGLGFSSSVSNAHFDGEAHPVPSRAASEEEILELCRETGRHPGTTLELAPGTDRFEQFEMSLMARMSLAADRPLNWNLVAANSLAPEIATRQLEASDYAREQGGCVVALTVPQPIAGRINLHSGVVFDAIPGWQEVLALPVAARIDALSKEEVRHSLETRSREAPGPFYGSVVQWDQMLVEEVFSSANAGIAGRRIGEIARERGRSPFDTLLDVSIADGLRTTLIPSLPGQNDDAAWRQRQQLWRDDRVLIGASDAGAHLDMIDTFAFSTALLGEGVRKRGLIGWEEAIHHLTGRPAALYGLHDRGALAVGRPADVVVFDPERVGSGAVHTRRDLPAAAARLYAEAEGIDIVMVNGVEIVREGRHTGALPGRVLRSGRDTRSVTAAAFRSLRLPKSIAANRPIGGEP